MCQLTTIIHLTMNLTVTILKKNKQANIPSFVCIGQPFIIAVSCGPVSTKGREKIEPKKSFKHSASTMN